MRRHSYNYTCNFSKEYAVANRISELILKFGGFSQMAHAAD